MTDDKPRYPLDRVVNMVLSACVLVALFALLRYLSDVLLPFAAAVVLAYLLNPLVAAFERKTGRRGLAVAMTICGLGIVALALVAVIVPLVASQAQRFQSTVTSLREDLSASIQDPPAALEPSQDSSKDSPSDAAPGTEKSPLGWRELTQAWADYRGKADDLTRSERLAAFRAKLEGTYLGTTLDQAIEYSKSDEFRELLVSTAKRIAVGGWTAVTFAVNVLIGLTGLIVVLIYLVFLLLDFPEYARTWESSLPPKYRDAILGFWEQFSDVMRRYFRGQVVVAIMTGLLFVIGFTLIDLPMALPLGLFMGLLNVVPYLQAVGLVPATMLAGLRAVEGDSSFVASVALMLAVFVLVQVIQDMLITPRVMGTATGLKPVSILLGVFVWGKLLGFLGLMLAIPLTCVGIAYYRRLVLTHATENKTH